MKVPSVTIYSTETCPYCKMEKEYLKEKKIKYTNYFVDTDTKKAEEMVKLTNQMGVPVTVLEYEDGTKNCFLGFRRDLLDKMIAGEKVGEPCTS